MRFGWSRVFQHLELLCWDSEFSNSCQVWTKTKGSAGTKLPRRQFFICQHAHIFLYHTPRQVWEALTPAPARYGTSAYRSNLSERLDSNSRCSSTLRLGIAVSCCWKGCSCPFSLPPSGLGAALCATSRKPWWCTENQLSKSRLIPKPDPEEQHDVRLGRGTGPSCCHSLLLLRPLRLSQARRLSFCCEHLSYQKLALKEGVQPTLAPILLPLGFGSSQNQEGWEAGGTSLTSTLAQRKPCLV